MVGQKKRIEVSAKGGTTISASDMSAGASLSLLLAHKRNFGHPHFGRIHVNSI
jgi:hypothetical protein